MLKEMWNLKVISGVFLLIAFVECQNNPINYQYTVNGNIKKRNAASDHIITFPGETNRPPRPYLIDQQTPLAPFPESVTKSRITEDNNEIPMELLERLNNLSNISEFFDEFIAPDSLDPRDIVGRFGGENVERSAAVSAKPAGCIPEQTVVPLKPDNAVEDSSIIYFPSCTRVNRCGGCCSHKLLSCQPVTSETLTFQVIKSQYTGGNKMVYRGKEIVLVDQHTKCKCDCAIQEKDCNNFQKYDKSQCKCYCTNLEDQNKCLSESDLKIWDSSACVCRCREIKECTTGSYFEQNQCRCLQIPTLRYNQTILDRKRFIIKAVPVPVIQKDDTRYHTFP